MSPRYRVTLTEEERSELEALAREGLIAGNSSMLAPCFFATPAPDGPAWKVADVVDALGVTSRSIEHLKKRFVEKGLGCPPEKAKRKIAAGCYF